MIKLVIFDIDGVLTDGTLIIDSEGREQKRLNLKDVDAIYELKKKGFLLAAITGENTSIVKYFEKRFPWDFFYRGCKQKKQAVLDILKSAGISEEEFCYVGDGKYDVEPLKFAALGICPVDAIDAAKDVADIILQRAGGEGGIWELLSIIETFNDNKNPENYFLTRLQEHNNVCKKIASDRELMAQIMKVGKEIIETFKSSGTLFLCGNGGSAADAQHIATEFISKFYKERPGLNAEALSVNTSAITAIGNDYSFEKVFVRQLEAKGKRGDVLIGITTSGTSKNILEAIRYSRKNGIRTVLLMGESENPELKSIADYIIKVPALVTPRIQEMHIFIGHVIAEYVEHEMFSDNIEERYI